MKNRRHVIIYPIIYRKARKPSAWMKLFKRSRNLWNIWNKPVMVFKRQSRVNSLTAKYDMNKRKYTTVLYIRIEQYIAFVRTLRHHPDYEFVSIKMTYARCKDGIYRHFGSFQVMIRFRSYPSNQGEYMFYFGRIFQRELDKMKLINY